MKERRRRRRKGLKTRKEKRQGCDYERRERDKNEPTAGVDIHKREVLEGNKDDKKKKCGRKESR